MKLDQETFVKHQFWFLLGGYFLIWLIAMMWMKFTYPSEIDALRQKYQSAVKDVNDAKRNPVNTATFLPPWEKEAKEFSDHKGKIWKAAWEYQAGMYDWPQEWLSKYDMTNFQTQIAPDDRNEYREKLYPNQIAYWRANLPKLINPVELKDGFDNIFQPKTDWKEIPTHEEIWLTQEDFWVKRELFFVIYNAMARQAEMHPVPIDEKKEPTPKGVVARYRYRNKNWEITLNIRKNDKGYFVLGHDSTIKNIHPTRHPQPLTSAKGRGIWFNVVQDNVRTLFEVRGEPVPWNDTKNFSEEDYPEPLGGIKWDKEWLKEHPISVSQGFDLTNCPIRRINAIELAKQDCRTFIWPLQPNHALAKLDAPAEEEKPADAGAAGTSVGTGAPGMGGAAANQPGGGSAMMQQMMSKGGLNMGGTATTGNKTPNNDIERDRYLQPKDLDKNLNPPSRHLPLAMQLIVEQTHINDLLVALANSRLRFQVTQVDFRHLKDYVPQSESDKDNKDGDTAGPRVFMGSMPSMTGGPMQMQMQQMQRQRMMQQQMSGGGMGGMADMQKQMQMQMQMQQRMQMGGAGGAMGSAGMMAPPAYAPGGRMRPSYAPGGKMRSATGFSPSGREDQKQATSDQQIDDNLVELTIYGIATLYRAPDAPTTTEQANPGTSAPSAPPGQQPAAAATPTNTSPQATQTTASNAAPPDAKQTGKSGDSQKTPSDAKQTGKSGDPQKTPPDAKQTGKSGDPQKTPPSPPAEPKKD